MNSKVDRYLDPYIILGLWPQAKAPPGKDRQSKPIKKPILLAWLRHAYIAPKKLIAAVATKVSHHCR